MANIEQAQQMIPLITCEISLGQYVCELALGVNVFDLDLGVQINSIKQPIKSNSVGPGNVSHCGTFSLYDHLDHCFTVFEHIQQSFLTRRIGRLRKQNQHCPDHRSFHEISVVFDFGFCWTVRDWSLFLTHPTYGDKRVTSKYALNSVEVKNSSLHYHLERTPSDFLYVLSDFSHQYMVHQFAFHQSLDVWVNSSRFPEACSSSDSRWCLCVEFFWFIEKCHFQLLESVCTIPSRFLRVYTSPSYSLESHAGICNELLNFVVCNSQLPASWIFFAAFSLRLLSLCDSFACTSRPCNSSFDQLRLSDVIGSKFQICNFDLGFSWIAPNI